MAGGSVDEAQGSALTRHTTYIHCGPSASGRWKYSGGTIPSGASSASHQKRREPLTMENQFDERTFTPQEEISEAERELSFHEEHIAMLRKFIESKRKELSGPTTGGT